MICACRSPHPVHWRKCLKHHVCPRELRFSRQLDSKLRGKVVEILRNYVKISVLRCVCLAFRAPFKWTWNEGRSEANGSSPL